MKCHQILLVPVFLACSLSSFCSPAFALHDLTFSWLPNQEDIDGYKVYIGTVSGRYDTVIELPNPQFIIEERVQITITGLDDYTTYYFVSTAYSGDLESDYSREIVWDPNVTDSDGDGLVHVYEMRLGTDPESPDTDGDGIIDGRDSYPLDPAQSVCSDTIKNWDTEEVYDFIWRAYYSGSVQNGDKLQMTSSRHNEDLVFDLDISVTLSGGYDCTFSNTFVNTEIDGTLTISNGTVTINNITLL